mmetsp:Transcript_7216/g.15752  ORF Transcript_7216/g.15752 Transcript_7216/m.15752 type:complete len:378 (-) Transcript_7216:519-1652(-)
MMRTAALLIDGSILEGGGQILRNSAALAAITGTSITVDKIRAGRSRPGLRPQHLTGLQLVERMCEGSLEGGTVGSSRITLQPRTLSCGEYIADTQTAGSCTLMVQQSLPCLLFAKPHRDSASNITKLVLRGGTDADMAPPVDYFVHVLFPTLQTRLGLSDVKVECMRRGFMPRGGGEIHVTAAPLPPGTSLQPLDITTRGEVSSIRIHAFSAGRVAASVPERMAAAAEQQIRTRLGAAVPVSRHTAYEPAERAYGDGCGILLVAETSTGCLLAGSAKGQRGVASEAVAATASSELLEELEAGACVDQWMQDQLIILMALAAGESRMLCSEPTLHTRTAMVIAEQVLPGAKFSVSTVTQDGRPGQLYMIRCKGAGWQA